MEKITQKNFKTILEENANVYRAYWRGRTEKVNKVLENYITIIDSQKLPEAESTDIRRAERVQTNAIFFTGGGVLYFNTAAKNKKYYQYKNFIFATEESCKTFEDDEDISIILGYEVIK